MCLNPGDILHARYQIIDVLGRGEFVTTYNKTYKARDLEIPDDSVYVVVKEIQLSYRGPTEEAQERFETEALVLLRLGEHDRIPRLFAHFQESTCSQEREKFYLILEYIEGHPLNKEITPNTQWTEEQLIEFLQDILPVIQFIHQNNVIHRDIKPSNLIRRSCDNKIVVIDFGAVTEISTLNQHFRVRLLNIGTSGYMAPEQFNGCPEFYSDIYSIGVICIQALTGLDARELSRYIHNHTWRSIPDRPIAISDRLIAILNRMVCYDFLNRYQCVDDILQDLN